MKKYQISRAAVMIMDRTVMADLYFSTAGDSCGASNSSIVGLSLIHISEPTRPY